MSHNEHVDDNMITKEQVMEKLSTVEDPELAMNIVDLGLIYEVNIENDKNDNTVVNIKMTLTTPACPLLGQLMADIEEKVKSIGGIEDVNLELVWEPPWSPEMMSERAKLMLGVV